MHAYIHIHTYVYIHTYIHEVIHKYIHAYTIIHTHIHAFVYIHPYIHAYSIIHTYTYTHVHTHIRMPYIHTRILQYSIWICLRAQGAGFNGSFAPEGQTAFVTSVIMNLNNDPFVCDLFRCPN